MSIFVGIMLWRITEIVGFVLIYELFRYLLLDKIKKFFKRKSKI